MAVFEGGRDERMAQMNITPLVDVMLVLLIIFMVTMPLRTQGITVPLPVPDRSRHAPPPVVDLRIAADGQLVWNGRWMSMSTLADTMQIEASRHARADDQPVLRIDAAADARYDTVAAVLVAATNAGLVHISFQDQPPQ